VEAATNLGYASAAGVNLRRKQSRSRSFRLKKAALTAGALLVTVNLWTGAPLLAVLTGSLVDRSNYLTPGALVLVLVTLAALAWLLMVALVRLNAAYDELTGRPPAPRRTSPWLRSVHGEPEPARRRRFDRSNPIELAAVASTVAAVLALEAYFFFVTPPLPYPVGS
jgi:hypothetical protein